MMRVINEVSSRMVCKFLLVVRIAVFLRFAAVGMFIFHMGTSINNMVILAMMIILALIFNMMILVMRSHLMMILSVVYRHFRMNHSVVHGLSLHIIKVLFVMMSVRLAHIFRACVVVSTLSRNVFFTWLRYRKAYWMMFLIFVMIRVVLMSMSVL